MALDLAQVGALAPPNRKERTLVEQIAKESDPIFPCPLTPAPSLVDIVVIVVHNSTWPTARWRANHPAV
jgi:hypothetical protein